MFEFQTELQKLCEERGVKLVARYGEARQPAPPGWSSMPVNNWRVTLKYRGRQLTTDFYAGDLISDVTAADVLYSLCLDGRAGEVDFNEFCSDFGYDFDSRGAHEIWKACQKISRKVHRLLGEDFELFLETEH